jgi:AraC family transcriptional regulator
LTVRHLKFSPVFRRPRHRHDDACIQVILRGRFHEHGWKDRETFEPGEAIFRPAGFEHSNDQMHDSADALSIEVSARSVPTKFVDSVVRARPTRVLNPHVNLLANRIGHELGLADEFSASVIDALCVEVVVHVLREATTTTPNCSMSRQLAEKAAEVISRRAAEALSVDAVAELFGVDRFELNRAFLKRWGCCPSEYIRLRRVEQAQRLLLHSTLPIAIIAEECGFADQSHMTRVFNVVLGETPARFRAGRARG